MAAFDFILSGLRIKTGGHGAVAFLGNMCETKLPHILVTIQDSIRIFALYLSTFAGGIANGESKSSMAIAIVFCHQFLAEPHAAHGIFLPVICANVAADLFIDHAAANQDGEGDASECGFFM